MVTVMWPCLVVRLVALSRMLVLAVMTVWAMALRVAWADVYTYTDHMGITHYSNVAESAEYRLMVSLSVQIDAVLNAEGGSNQAKAVPKSAAVKQYMPTIAQVAVTEGVDKALLHAVVTAESGYNAQAVSSKGAMGLMQLMPATARRYGVVDAFDPEQNLKAGARYLRELMQLFDNNLELVLAAYNAGEGAVTRHGMRVPPYRETMAYVPKVMRYYRRYSLTEL